MDARAPGAGPAPADGAGKRLNSRGRGCEPGRGNPRSRAFNSLRAEAQVPAAQPGRRARGAGSSAGQETPRPVGAQGAGASGQPQGLGRIVSGFPALLSRLRLLRLRLPVPSPASRAPRDVDFGWSPEEAGSFLSSARE
uniref:Translation initiation factor IF-2-like n=1 Tax=Camelus bactrianus TaxID=9837 RepID=A0A9W3HFM2_CAMBA|nr:translation initiation factor IF-2-like [Camelus bactrianus]